jgi:hypothetical protein
VFDFHGHNLLVKVLDVGLVELASLSTASRKEETTAPGTTDAKYIYTIILAGLTRKGTKKGDSYE